MLDKIKGLFKEGLEYTHTAGILQQVANLLNIVHVQYMKDADGKNAAIDAVCEILQSHKDAPVVAATSTEQPGAAAECSHATC